MTDFCQRCGSLLLWNFSGGRRVRKCPRCGRLEEAQAKDEGSPPSVRKGVSPRSSSYARRSISTAVLSERSDVIKGKGPDQNCSVLEPVPDGIPFPFDGVRKGQLDFMKDVDDTIRREGFLLAKVPTGIGKTAAALSPAAARSLKDGSLTMFLTSKQSQHAIAVETVRRMAQRWGLRIRAVDVMSKQSMCPRDIASLPRFTFNHMCKQQQKDGTCPFYKPTPEQLVKEITIGHLPATELSSLAASRRICPHRAALESAREADVMICDFNYVFSDLRDPILKGIGRDLKDLILIVDEGHNLPDRIRSNLSSELNLGTLEDVEGAMSSNRRLRHYVSEIARVISSAVGAALDDKMEAEIDRRELLSNIRGAARTGLDEGVEIEDILDAVEKHAVDRGLKDGDGDPLLWFVEFLRGLLEIKESHLLFASRPEKGNGTPRLIYRNLDPSEISGPVLKACRSAVIMSGTLSPPSMFGDILGMARDRRMEREYVSPFPATNKLTLLDDTVTTSYNSRGESMFSRIAARIVEAANATPGNSAAFFPSYSLMEEIGKRLDGVHKAVLTEDRSRSGSRKVGVMEDLESGRRRGGSLLLGVMGGSLSEGLDYRDNLLSTVAIVGLPLAPPTLDVMALREYSRKKWGRTRGDEYSYDYPAVNRMLQAAGRSIRSESDRSVILLLERRYLEPRYIRFLPEEMIPKVVKGDIARHVRDFYSPDADRSPQGT
ncbi:MAG: helicase C-terminal domain-containing protein [Candidatus Thermoplasmatota archaeon]|nr:helicase C-terminal domain-containing protein [Candidatus Thermoplasmatota archaeon]